MHVQLREPPRQDPIRRVCVFCGSGTGRDPQFLSQAKAVGRTFAENAIGLVYGGASVGLMGALADAAMDGGGQVVGVIPEDLVRKEVAHRGLRDLRIVSSMHERKRLMTELSDGFIAMSGGIGTLEEFFEVWTWAQLGHHTKPCGLLNSSGFFDPLLAFLDHVETNGFIRQEHRRMLIVENTIEGLLAKFHSYKAPQVQKWLNDDAV